MLGAAVWRRVVDLDRSEISEWFATGNMSENHMQVALGLDPLDVESNPAAWELVRSGLAGPIRLFVKNEPHSAAKAAQQRWRLISSVEVVDQLVERLLHWEQNELEIMQWQRLPVKAGMGLDDESLGVLVENVHEFKDPKCTDASGWDWCVQYSGYKHFVDHRLKLAQRSLGMRHLPSGLAEFGFLARVMRARAACLMMSTFVLSDGHVFVQTDPGIQKSGSFCTASSNSYMRWYLARMVGAISAMCMGDDAIEEGSEFWDPSLYTEWGYRIELSEHAGIDFCSHNIGKTVEECYPLNDSKLVMRCLMKKPVNEAKARELIASLQSDLRHHAECQYWLGLVAAGWGLATNN